MDIVRRKLLLVTIGDSNHGPRKRCSQKGFKSKHMKVPFLSSVINQRSMTLNSALQSIASWLKTFKSNKCSLIGSSIVNTSDHNWYCTNFHFSIHSRHYLKWITSTLFSKSSYLASGLFWINSMTIWKKRNRTVKLFCLHLRVCVTRMANKLRRLFIFMVPYS